MRSRCGLVTSLSRVSLLTVFSWTSIPPRVSSRSSLSLTGLRIRVRKNDQKPRSPLFSILRILTCPVRRWLRLTTSRVTKWMVLIGTKTRWHTSSQRREAVGSMKSLCSSTCRKTTRSPSRTRLNLYSSSISEIRGSFSRPNVAVMRHSRMISHLMLARWKTSRILRSPTPTSAWNALLKSSINWCKQGNSNNLKSSSTHRSIRSRVTFTTHLCSRTVNRPQLGMLTPTGRSNTATQSSSRKTPGQWFTLRTITTKHLTASKKMQEASKSFGITVAEPKWFEVDGKQASQRDGRGVT